MADDEASMEPRSLLSTPTWSVAAVLSVLVMVCFMAERSVYSLTQWLEKTRRKALGQALEKMKQELMLSGFLSLLLTATSKLISGICIKSIYYDSTFSPCKPSSEYSESGRKLLQDAVFQGTARHLLTESAERSYTCRPGYEPFVSLEGLEQLHLFIFVLTITHITYTCLTMLLASIKVYSWRRWESEALNGSHDGMREITRALTMKRQSTFVMYHASRSWSSNRLLIWVVCFFRQFGQSVTKADYLTLRLGFITNHKLVKNFDFHRYMIRSMEEEFHEIVGISAPLWALVVTLILFNIGGWNLYFWVSFVPVSIVLVVGAKLQHVIATLALENAGLVNHHLGTTVKPRDELFWFNKPELLLWLIHFILFQNAFEFGSFLWFWWQFGLTSCFLRKAALVYIRLAVGVSSQILCSYSTFPLYALVTQMGTKYKASVLPVKIRKSLYEWQKAAKKKVRHGYKTEAGVTVVAEDTGNPVETCESESALLEVEMNTCPETVLSLEDVNVKESSQIERVISITTLDQIEMNTCPETVVSSEDVNVKESSQIERVISITTVYPIEGREED